MGIRSEVSSRAVFLDRDGVLNRALVRGNKPYPPGSVEELEILPGAEIVIVSRAPYGGPISLRVSGHLLAIGPTLASQVMVEPLTDMDAPAH